MLYLASASPRRHELLKQLNIAHQVLHVPTPEGEDEPIMAGEQPADYAQRTAQEKLQRAYQWLSQQDLPQTAAILCADTCVALDDEVLGKPNDIDQARQFLQRLSGRAHWVYTAQALYHRGQSYHSLSRNKVLFRALNETEIEHYCRSQEPFGKAGGYAIQGQASYFIDSLQGRYSAVMGLDVYDLYQLLQQANLGHLCWQGPTDPEQA